MGMGMVMTLVVLVFCYSMMMLGCHCIGPCFDRSIISRIGMVTQILVDGDLRLR
jgi:hypothetical protein